MISQSFYSHGGDFTITERLAFRAFGGILATNSNQKPAGSGPFMERRLLERNKVSTTVYVSAPGASPIRCHARNLSAMGVFLEINSLGLPAGTVVNLVFAVDLGDTVRLHRRKAVVAHISERGAGLMMQGRSQQRPAAKRAS